MAVIAGVLLLVVGIVALVFGEHKLNVTEGTILKFLTHSQKNVKLIRWAFGLVAIYLGIGLILGWFK